MNLEKLLALTERQNAILEQMSELLDEFYRSGGRLVVSTDDSVSAMNVSQCTDFEMMYDGQATDDWLKAEFYWQSTGMHIPYWNEDSYEAYVKVKTDKNLF